MKTELPAAIVFEVGWAQRYSGCLGEKSPAIVGNQNTFPLRYRLQFHHCADCTGLIPRKQSMPPDKQLFYPVMNYMCPVSRVSLLIAIYGTQRYCNPSGFVLQVVQFDLLVTGKFTKI